MKRSEPMSESYYYILLCLAKGANHGYGIMQMTEKLSGGDVTIGSGTMYGATSNMMKKGWIREILSDAYQLNIPSGATIICVSILIYTLCKIYQNIKSRFCASAVQ